MSDESTTTLRGPVLVDGRASYGEITIFTQMIEMRFAFATEPDLRWSDTDPSGHFHAYAHDGSLPTLDTIREHVDCNGCGDEDCDGYDVVTYVCSICRAPVEPKTKPAEDKIVPGQKSWEATVDIPVEMGKVVSVRAELGGRTAFGVGRVVSFEMRNERAAQTTIGGISELGVTKPL